MSVIELLPGDVNYYKANLHCHTTVSDGELTPEEIKKLYQSRGYSIVAYTDHHRYRNHSQLNDENFLAIAGVEMDVDDFEDSRLGTGKAKQYHFNLFDTDPDYRNLVAGYDHGEPVLITSQGICIFRDMDLEW